jgi:alpha/beta superfamily hydrolase
MALHDPPEGRCAESGLLAAVVCHPHPLHGGTMDNKVVFSLARVFRERGMHCVRFNFRGAGGSQGVHDEGRGERQDLAAALDFAWDQLGSSARDGCLALAGFSFGSFVAQAEAAEDSRVGALLLVAPPVTHYSYLPLADMRQPTCVIYAGQDELVPAKDVEAWLKSAAARPDRHASRVEGATHLFHAKLGELRAAAGSFLDQLHASV